MIMKCPKCGCETFFEQKIGSVLDRKRNFDLTTYDPTESHAQTFLAHSIRKRPPQIQSKPVRETDVENMKLGKFLRVEGWEKSND